MSSRNFKLVNLPFLNSTREGGLASLDELAEKENTEARRHRGTELFENRVTGSIINAAIEVHKVLGGPGILESIYEDALAHELEMRGIQVKRQLQVPVLYKNLPIRDAMRLDLLVENQIIIEVKATEHMSKVHTAQVLTYLRLTQRKLGLVLNFGQPLLRDGITRVINE